MHDIVIHSSPSTNHLFLMSQRKQKLTKPIMVRMNDAMKQDIERIAAANDLTTSDIIRLAMHRQLPSLRQGDTNLQPS